MGLTLHGLFSGLEPFIAAVRDIFLYIPEPVQVLTIGCFGVIILLAFLKFVIL